MFARIFLLLLITPVVELALLIRLGGIIGFWSTVAIIAATALLGTFLVKREGLAVWQRFNERLRSGELPGTELVDGVIILLAGALLVTPGVLTDVLGIAGLLAPTRALFRARIVARLQQSVAKGVANTRFEAHFGGSEFEAQPNNGWKGAGRDVPQHQQGSGESRSTRPT